MVGGGYPTFYAIEVFKAGILDLSVRSEKILWRIALHIDKTVN
jgi:hypothetical protein